LDELKRGLRAFATRNRIRLSKLKERQSQLLEVGALMLAVEHYRLEHYAHSARNTTNRGLFRVKYGTRGKPWNFSWWEISRDGRTFQIHGNLAVWGAYGSDSGTFVVDVGVVRDVPALPDEEEQRALFPMPNEKLVTLLEAKGFNIYPMLLAHFVGIVHEITPQFLQHSLPQGFASEGHFDPALVVLGRFKENSEKIAKGFFNRGFHVRIVPRFDAEVAGLSQSRGRVVGKSPLRREPDRLNVAQEKAFALP